MEKIDVVLVVLNRERLESAVKNLNLDKVNITAIMTDGDTNEETVQVGENQIKRIAFSVVQKSAKKRKDSTWLISGCDIDALNKTKTFLVNNGVPEENIVNFELSAQISQAWLANLRYAENNGADFFVTGNEYIQTDLDLTRIPHGRGVNLADSNQTLRQSYLTAKYIFERVKPGTIKFVLIGLAPDSLSHDDAENFLSLPKNFQYSFALKNSDDKPFQDLISDDAKNIFNTADDRADLNFDKLKSNFAGNFSAKSIIDSEQKSLTAEFRPSVVEKNLQILKDYIKLCLDNGAKPIGIIFPFAPAERKIYAEEMILFRLAIRPLAEIYDFTCLDLFDLNLGYDNFADMTHLNSSGNLIANSLLSLELYKKGLIPIENFCAMDYEYFDAMSNVAPKDDYNALLENVFKASAQMIRRKDKIKIAFVTPNSAEWCGDELYNLFANNERFETTLFLSQRLNRRKNELLRKDFLHGVEQFKSRGLNILPLDKHDAKIPAQDVLIFLTPYFVMLPYALRPKNITAKTLITHIPYSFSISVRKNAFYNGAIFHISWKIFFSSVIALNMQDKKSIIGMPRGLYSGYPRIDIFFDKAPDFHFDWKMARPDAKKIIYAPHWSINGVTNYATFQWNCKFMYEFAKAHPEISWVVKPHPALFFSAVTEKVFPTSAAFENYLKQWNDLPNAQVYTGAYYQTIFATSDGMIHDSGSFIAEYQFVNKPMIFLTREGEKFNDLGKAILNVSYLVDGKDLDGIAALMQKVFIDGEDTKSAERKKVFDKYLNYPKLNGMLASEFIYKNIADELTEDKK